MFDSPSMSKFPEYDYDRLTDKKKAIRLLRLRTGPRISDMIECEIFTAEFSDKYVPEYNGQPIQYEALSWSWGIDIPQHGIVIIEGKERYKLRVKRELALALKYLRKTNRERVLWIDYICIDQADFNERNHQVQMMAMIYTRAKKVCIWLGEDDNHTNMAIHFISSQIMRLDRFDIICKDEQNTDNWQALLALMQRRWFRRRWVVQEVALARRAKVYCGEAKISWTDFAVAVELFVEVETATHRLSEVIQKDARFYHVPNWFEYVSELGASRLVQATASVFRIPETAQTRPAAKMGSMVSGKIPNGAFINGMTANSANSTSNMVSPSPSQVNGDNSNAPDGPVDPLDRRGLLSLEHLVSTLSTFESSEPRDVIYSLLAIARDTTPLADINSYRSIRSRDSLVMSTLSSFLERKPYRVDYNLAYSDVCREFVQFCIERSMVSDPSKALDILCRPWAPPANKEDKQLAELKNLLKKKKKKKKNARAKQGDSEGAKHKKKGIWVDKVQIHLWLATKKHMKRTKESKEKQSYKEARNDGAKNWEVDSRKTDAWKKEWIESAKAVGEGVLKYIPYLPKEDDDDTNGAEEDPQEGSQVSGISSNQASNGVRPPPTDSSRLQTATSITEQKDVQLPSWVSSIDGAPFAVFEHPGMHVNRERMGRKNADPLVGHPQGGLRNYTAAQTQKPEGKLDFRKRPVLGHYSFFVRGFVLDEISEVSAPAYGGNIPKAWTEMAGWDDWRFDPPDDFLRTLVADRGKDNRNPPHYYAKACRESVVKGSGQSGRVDINGLINNEQNSIITEFCRRVQEVIWNRRLIKTKRGTLGLSSDRVDVGDLVCIIYGCSVPVILRAFKKDVVELEKEASTAGGSESKRKSEDMADATQNHATEQEANFTIGRAKRLCTQLDTIEKKPNPTTEDQQEIQQLRAEALEVSRRVISGLAENDLNSPRKPEDPKEKALEIALKKVLDEEEKDDDWEKIKGWIRRCELKLVKKARYRQLVQGGFEYNMVKFSGPDYKKYIEHMKNVANEHLKSLEDAELKKKIGDLGARIVLHQVACEHERRVAGNLERAAQKEEMAARQIRERASEAQSNAEKLEKHRTEQLQQQQQATPEQRASQDKEAEEKLEKAKADHKIARQAHEGALEAQEKAKTRVEESESKLKDANAAINEKNAHLQNVRPERDPANKKVYVELDELYKKLNPKKKQGYAYQRLYFCMMGESYIHGMMDGDAIRERFQQDIQERWFELR